MDDQKSLFLNWTYFNQDKNMDVDEIRQSLLLSMELEELKLRAQEEIKLRDQQISQLKQILTTTITERNLAQQNCQKVLYENLLLQQQYQNSAQQSAISSIDDETTKLGFDSNSAFTSSDCDESIVSSPIPHQDHLPIVLNKPLPEKGKLLEAVMKAGPLLQTLLLAGPLPQWRHPPPPIDTYQIPQPPVVIPTMPLMNQEFIKIKNCMKRSLPTYNDTNDSCPSDFKYQRIVLQ